jgi:hypothetical protein
MPFVFAKTGSTTAQIAARPVKSTPWIKMSAEPRKTILKFTGDPRLRAGVRAALEHICERRGLSAEEKHKVSAAIEKECDKVFDSHEEPNCILAIDEMEDRMQISVKSASGEINASVVKHFQRNPAHP